MKYERIRNLREDNDLTQQQIADKLFINRRTPCCLSGREFFYVIMQL